MTNIVDMPIVTLVGYAADAMGYVVDDFTTGGAWVHSKNAVPDSYNEYPQFMWSPAYDDADSFAMMVKLRITPLLSPTNECVMASYMQNFDVGGYTVKFEDFDGDEAAATRRAILFAAAAMGMKQ